jgi:F0F1-type ATP synthase assembly protein I
MGLSWATRVTALGLEFVLPTLGGYYLDKQWGTQPLVTVLGSAAGFAAGMVHLLRIAKEGSRR